jgi:hypothetical protein
MFEIMVGHRGNHRDGGLGLAGNGLQGRGHIHPLIDLSFNQKIRGSGRFVKGKIRWEGKRGFYHETHPR